VYNCDGAHFTGLEILEVQVIFASESVQGIFSHHLLKESSMKKVLLVAVAILMVASVSLGQDVTPGLTGGSKALLFTFGGLSTLSANNFSGGFGAKYYLSSSMAVRAGLQFSSASTTTPANPGTGQVGADGSTSNTTIGVAAAIELHLGSGRVSPYLGGGVGFSTTSTESKNPAVATPPATPTQTTVKNANAPTTFTVYALAGFEFFLWKELSLSGEYRIGFSSSSLKDQETTTGATTTTVKQGSSSTIGIAAQGALTLAVYF
jgi:opacity protein-like surface antigen